MPDAADSPVGAALLGCGDDRPDGPERQDCAVVPLSAGEGQDSAVVPLSAGEGQDSAVVPLSAGERQGTFEGMPTPLYAASPSKLLAFLDCPRRYRFAYLDRPAPPKRPQRAHTSLGNSIHNALRDWWDHPDLTPETGAALVRRSWIDVGFRDAAQSTHWREHSAAAVTAYLRSVDPTTQPRGIERTVSFVSDPMRIQGRIDRLDERDGEFVVVDYKTSRVPPTDDDARVSLPLALYAAAVWKMFKRPTFAVELHHVPTGAIARHRHTPESLTRHVERAKAIARDARRADRDHATRGEESTAFPAVTGPLCGWCDFRAHCPEGQQASPEKSDWAALEEPAPVPTSIERH